MKNMKKLVSLLLAVVMVFAMTVTTFAEETAATKKLTIKNSVAGHTYEVYQLLIGDVSGLADGTGTLANIEAGLNLKTDTTAAAFAEAVQGKSGAELGDLAWSYVTGDNFGTITGTGNDASLDVAPGYYLVKDTITGETDITTVSRYMVAVVGDTEITPKTNDVPDLDKNIVDTDANKAFEATEANPKGKTDSAAIGDVIEYEMTSKVPNTEGYKYYYYVVNDTMSKGLTFNAGSVEVWVGGNKLTSGYSLYTGTDATPYTFQIAFDDLKALVDAGTVKVGDDIKILYTATVNKDAEIGYDPNTNTVTLTYSNNPNESERHDDKPGTPGEGTVTGVTPERNTKTYVTQLTLNKVDENMAALDGAEFTLTGTNLNKVVVTTATEFKAVEAGTGEYYKLKDGKYTTVDPTADTTDKYETTTKDYELVTTTSTDAVEVPSTGYVAVLKNGTITITGLNAGTYTLTETKTPAGYNTIDPITFTIGATSTTGTPTEGGAVTWTISPEDSLVKLDATLGVYNATIINRKGTVLPSTGGIGTTIFYVLGTILVLVAGVLMIAKRRMAR